MISENDMARLNLTLSDEFYSVIDADAKEKGVSVNNLVYNVLVHHFIDTDFDILEEFEKIKKEASEREGNYSLNDLKSFQDLDDKLKESNYPESLPQVKSRISLMFKNSVEYTIHTENGDYTIHQDENDKEKTYDRAVSYYNLFTGKKK